MRILKAHVVNGNLDGLRGAEDLESEISAIHRMILQSRSSSKSGGAAARTKDGADQRKSIDWGGYNVVVNSSQMDYFGPVQYESAPVRDVGSGGNLIIGGVLIGSERAPATAAACFGKHHHLVQECSTQEQLQSRTAAAENSDSSGHGRDPVFIHNSALFDRKIAPRVSEFYNTTNGSPHMAGPHGIPHGFIYGEREAELLGIHNFVFFDIALTEHDASRLLRYLHDGRYMDKLTRSSSLSMVTYSPRVRVIGFTTANCNWGTQVGCAFEVNTVPDTTWIPGTEMGLKACISGLLIFFLVFVYCVCHFWSWYSSCTGSSGATFAMKPKRRRGKDNAKILWSTKNIRPQNQYHNSTASSGENINIHHKCARGARKACVLLKTRFFANSVLFLLAWVFVPHNVLYYGNQSPLDESRPVNRYSIRGKRFETCQAQFHEQFMYQHTVWHEHKVGKEPYISKNTRIMNPARHFDKPEP